MTAVKKEKAVAKKVEAKVKAGSKAKAETKVKVKAKAQVKVKKVVAKIVKPKASVVSHKAEAVSPKPAAVVKESVKHAPPKEPFVFKKEIHPVKIEVPAPEVHKPEPPKIKPAPEVKVEIKPKVEVKVEPKPELKVKAEVKAELKVEVKPVAPAVELKDLEINLPITVKDLAIKLQEKSSAIIKILMGMGIMTGINQSLQEDVAAKICEKYRFRIKIAPDAEELALSVHTHADDPKDLVPRSPIVTFMGHVDHGKTSLLDAIRKTKVVDSEHGGITQHIGAYRVSLPHGEITFLDTPGHEAFTAMRARGASITDIVVLVVAADDGIMPQTKEAIDHARAAGVSLIIAVNKIDKAGADVDRVKKQLSELGLMAEDWGGKTIIVPVSAKTGSGIDNLLEMIILEAQMLELKSNPGKLAKGVIIEAKMSKGRGHVSTLLVQAGTLHLNDNIVVGNLYGKIRAMFNDRGLSTTSAGPGVPVEILGISGTPSAGEPFFAIADEKEAKALAQKRSEKERLQQIKSVKRLINLEELHAQIAEGKIKELKLIIKADVQGSLEAIKDTLEKLNVSEIKLVTIHDGVGNINSSDAMLAVVSNALIVGFNVASDDLAKEIIAKEGVEVRTYNIIYELANEIKAAVEGMLEPKLKKVFLGRVDVRKVFKLSRSGMVAGCFVSKGKVNRNSLVSLVRNGQVVFEGKISTLKRFKDDVRDVAEGFECGITLAGFDQMMEGDSLEAYDIEKIARKL